MPETEASLPTVTSIRTILFDMGNVLVFFSHERMCRQMAEVCDVTPTRIRETVFDTELQWRFERGQISEAAFHRTMERILDRSIDIASLRRAVADIFEPHPEIMPLLWRLKTLGIRLVLLSNTCRIHIDWVRDQFSVLDPFDSFVLSCEVGAIKPEPAIYERALEEIQCLPEECFYTDDIPRYVEVGRQFGLQAEVFRDVATLARHLRARGLDL